jgi:signal recognition particle receptor subunit beta
MMSAQELKIVFTGPMGAGKTTAIRAISDAPPVSTEVGNHDQQAFNKESTTVALDYGELALEDGTAVRLYGTPGQGRFSFMWDIVGRGALGVVLLLDASSASVKTDLTTFVDVFRRTTPDQPFIVGVGRLPPEDGTKLDEFARSLADIGVVAPVFAVDVRERADVLLLIETLLCILETRMPEVDHASV